jgi:hypothetical protein
MFSNSNKEFVLVVERGLKARGYVPDFGLLRAALSFGPACVGKKDN